MKPADMSTSEALLRQSLDADADLLPSGRRAFRLILGILDRQTATYPYWADATRDEKAQALTLLDEAIAGGMVEAYVLSALLSASNDWKTCRILRPGEFRVILEEGVAHGCLAPDRARAWTWLAVAAENNDPTFFMDDMDQYYDLLYRAAAAGNGEALALMNAVWAPEHLVEED